MLPWASSRHTVAAERPTPGTASRTRHERSHAHTGATSAGTRQTDRGVAREGRTLPRVIVAPRPTPRDVALTVSRGVSSATFVQAAAQAANDAAEHGIETIILFDYDAGGARAKKMIRDSSTEYCDYVVQIHDIAVTEAQIRSGPAGDQPAEALRPALGPLDGARPAGSRPWRRTYSRRCSRTRSENGSTPIGSRSNSAWKPQIEHRSPAH